NQNDSICFSSKNSDVIPPINLLGGDSTKSQEIAKDDVAELKSKTKASVNSSRCYVVPPARDEAQNQNGSICWTSKNSDVILPINLLEGDSTKSQEIAKDDVA